MSPSQKNNSSRDKPKRVRRKCTAPGCENRVVQGGVCVTHGAKRKLCTHPGCSKAVKAAGLCSTHGPSRKKCTYVDPSSGSPCFRVAVQGGRCLSHGARRRFCSFPGKEVCTKNAVAGGYCKKHHDMVEDANGILDFQSSPSNKSVSDSSIKNTTAFCAPVGSIPGGSLISGASSSSVSDHSSVASSSAATDMVGGGAVLGQPQLSPLSMQDNEHFNKSSSAPLNNKNPAPKKKPPTAMRVSKFPSIYSKPNHKRGLSLYDEMSVVDAIIGAGGEQREPAVPSSGAGVAKQQQFDVLVGTSTGNVVRYSGVQKKAKLEQPHPPAQRQLPADSTKTPQTQVTFADSVRNNSQEAPLTAKSTAQNPEDVCLRNPSCTCSACRSPTLAIFDQMIQASQKIDQGETEDERYAGLSPPKLGHSKTSAATSEHNKSVKEEKTYDVLVGTSTGNVVRFSGEARNVSDNSLGVDEASSQHSPSKAKERAGAVAASSALTAAVKTTARDDDGGGNGGSCVNRTVSQDADSPRSRYHNYYGYGYPPPHPHPSHYYYPHHHPHPYYYQYQQPPHPHHHYPQHPPPPPNQAPGTPILNEDAAVTSQLSSKEKRKQQKRLLPKPRGKSLDCLFPASKELLP